MYLYYDWGKKSRLFIIETRYIDPNPSKYMHHKYLQAGDDLERVPSIAPISPFIKYLP